MRLYRFFGINTKENRRQEPSLSIEAKARLEARGWMAYFTVRRAPTHLELHTVPLSSLSLARFRHPVLAQLPHEALAQVKALRHPDLMASQDLRPFVAFPYLQLGHRAPVAPSRQ